MTNNAAERVIRGFVIWGKCSYGVRSHRGEYFRQRIMSLVETAKLTGMTPYLWVKTIVKPVLKELITLSLNCCLDNSQPLAGE